MAGAKKSAAKKPAGKPARAAGKGNGRDQEQKSRLWLMYPPRLITTPVVWQLARKFEMVTNVRQASVNDEVGIVCLELEGKRSEIKSAVKWLESQGVRVEPVEINVIES